MINNLCRAMALSAYYEIEIEGLYYWGVYKTTFF